MQQTKNLKLNIIETSDAFSPEPLNENMEKVEAAISRAYNPDNKPYVTGIYKGNNYTQTFTLGFRPSLVLHFVPNYSANTYNSGYGTVFMENVPKVFTFNDDGFSVIDTNGYFPTVNRSSSTYYYIAFR